MVKKFFLVFLVISVLTSSLATGVSAYVKGTASPGWIIHQTDGTIANCYRYGPSTIINSDNSIDAWFASPGRQFFYDNYTVAGTHTPVQLTGSDVAAQKFYTDKAFNRVGVVCPSWGNNVGALTIKVYAWNTNYNTTIAGTPIATYRPAYFEDNAYLSVTLDKDYPAGYYMWTLSEASEIVGVWKYTGSSVAGNVNYLNGAVVSGDYETRIGYWIWDVIKHKRSTDGGHTWSAEMETLVPNLRSKDHYSICDPGVIKIGSYYYLGYTSTEDTRGTDNDVFVARSTSPSGPWQKWNGSGWGGNPAPFIAFDGPTHRFGAGEPSFVEKDGTIYIYYTWDSEAADGTPIIQTRVATASAADSNWPGAITYRGVAIDKRFDQGMDSSDVKYIDSYGKFVAANAARRFSGNSFIQYWESADGITFQPGFMPKTNLQLNSHNAGISGTANGHIDLSKNNFVAYAYGSGWANWNTYLNPVTYSNDSKAGPPLIYTAHPGNGQVKIDFMTNSQATGYKIKYGTTSGSYTNTITGVTSSPYTITGLTNGTTYYFTVVATNANGDSENAFEVSAVPKNYINLTLSNATAATQLAGWEASKAIDGNQTTTYSSVGHLTESGTEWIQVDTGSTNSIARLTISPRERQQLGKPKYGSNLKIQVSANGSTWSDVNYTNYAILDSDSYFKDVVVLNTPASGRYVRVYATALNRDDNSIYYLQIGEIKVERV